MMFEVYRNITLISISRYVEMLLTLSKTRTSSVWTEKGQTDVVTTASLSLLKEAPEFLFSLQTDDGGGIGGGDVPPLCIVIRDVNAEGGDYYHYLVINGESDNSSGALVDGTLILPYEASLVPGHRCLYEVYTQAGYFALSGALGRQTTNFSRMIHEMNLVLQARIAVCTVADILQSGLSLAGRASQLSPRRHRIGTHCPSSQLSPRITSLVTTR